MKRIPIAVALVAAATWLHGCSREDGEPDPPVRQLVPCDRDAAIGDPLACPPGPDALPADAGAPPDAGDAAVASSLRGPGARARSCLMEVARASDRESSRAAPSDRRGWRRLPPARLTVPPVAATKPRPPLARRS